MHLFFCACEKGGNLVQSSAFFWNFFKLYFRKLYIVDARPRKNALANGAMGGGSESSSNYFQSEVCNKLEVSSCDFCFPVIIINLTLFSNYLNSYFILSDSLFGDRQHPCDERELCSAPRIHGHSWQNVIRWNVLFFG